MTDTAEASIASKTPLLRRRWLRILLWIVGSLAALLLLALVAAVLWLHASVRAALPVLDGDLRVSGLSAPVSVRRDAHGVPHIEAASERDLWIAQGYVTAQDRLWQMDMLRRSASGELAEILGPTMLRRDTEQRVLQFRRTAERVYASMPPAGRARVDAYAQGVNVFIAQHRDSLPPEFRLLMYKPRPWAGVDSILIGLNIVQMLDSHWEDKLIHERIAGKLNNPKLEHDLYPTGSWRDHPPTGELHPVPQPQPAAAKPASSDDEDDQDDRSQAALHLNRPRSAPAQSKKPGAPVLASLPGAQGLPSLHPSKTPGAPGLDSETWESTALSQPSPGAPGPSHLGTGKSIASLPQEDLKQLRAALAESACSDCSPGSNNWVVSGAHTASGRPLLANDMHLGLMEPNIWFMADLKAPGFHAAGVTLPGMPYIIAGHNDHVAWGYTALYADVQDLYIEKLDGRGNYEGNDAKWHALAVDRETIHVRGRPPVTLNVQLTAHGPLLTPIFQREKRPIALKWTLYDPALNSMPLYEINTAANWTEFRAALAQWSWPTQSVVYSDDQNHIAYQAIGRVPRRIGGAIFDKPLAHIAQNLRYEWGENDKSRKWQTYIPFDDMPSAVDPPSGFLATANSRVTTNKSPFPLTDEWPDPYRAERIYKLLENRDHLTPADMLAAQTDIYSEVDQQLAHRFAMAIDQTPSANAQLRQAAKLLRAWDGRLSADSPAASIVVQTRAALWPLLLKPKLGDEAASYHWAESNFAQEEIVMHGSPDWLPRGSKNWDELLTEAVRRALEEGHAPADLTRWTYGSWHVVQIDHPLSVLLPLIRHIVQTGPEPLSGDTTTVKQVGRSFGPSQRFIMDWSNVDGSTENIVLGEAGNPLSPYFRDQWNDWYQGTTFPLPYTDAAIQSQTLHTLRLVP